MNRPSSLYADENLFRAIVEASPAGMLIADEEGRIVLANRAAGAQFGYSIEELLGANVEQLIPETHRRAHQAHRARFMSQPEHRSMAAGRDLFGRRKDGSEFSIDISLHPIQVNDQQMVLANVLDATDRRRAEQEREQRQSMQRVALLGQLAGAVAHEIRTPLCVIRNDAYFLEKMADQLGHQGAECIQEINDAVTKAEHIVSELLDYTRDPQGEPDEVTLTTLIDTAVRGVSVPDTVDLQRSGDEDVLVHVDREQIERVLVNLIRNALQAIDQSGKITITTMLETDFAAVEVIDGGPGIEAEYVGRVFEPLFTTKPKGIGLGLAVSHRYAQRSGGTLTVRNTEDSGACFRLTLPLFKRLQ
jgi:PAS domain S-box-containing protein